LINGMTTGLIEGTVAASSGLADCEAVRTAPARIACFTPDAARCSRELKVFLRDNVYASDLVRSATQAFVGRMDALFDYFLAHPTRMPSDYREDAAAQPLHRQVCDYIAGMTDGFFLKTCEQLGIR
jgi:dGTPase